MYHSSPVWPPVLEVPSLKTTSIIDLETMLLADAAQAADMQTALLDMQGKVYLHHNGEKLPLQVSKVPHTWTEISAFCEEVKDLKPKDQHALMADALQVIYEGQTTYGAAGVNGTVISDVEPPIVGQLWARLQKVPPKPPSSWSEDSIRLRVVDSPGLRIRIDTSRVPSPDTPSSSTSPGSSASPTLDNWDTAWFIKLCEETIKRLERLGSPQETIGPFWYPLDPYWQQEITVRFRPIILPWAEQPTVAILINVMRTLIIVFEERGARELDFNLLNDENGHIGVGYLKFGQVPPPQLQDANSTIGNFTELLTIPGRGNVTGATDLSSSISNS